MEKHTFIISEKSKTAMNIITESEDDAIKRVDKTYHDDAVLFYGGDVDYEIKKLNHNSICQKDIILSDAEIERVYRKRLNYYQLQDAKAHCCDYIHLYNLAPMGIPLNIDYQCIVDDYNTYHDCNIAETDLWESIIEHYFQDN